MDRRRVFAVEGGEGPGSGYAVGPRLVLTSAHVVPDTGGTVRLFRPGRAEVWHGEVVWRGSPGGRDDAALLRIGDPGWQPPPGPPGVRWGRLVTDRPGAPGQAWGVPEIAQRDHRPTDTLQPTGTVSPGDQRIANRYVLTLDGQPPEGRADGGSPWGGMSGAALFCGELLTGVVAVDPAGWSHSRLDAVPVWLLLRDPAFREALAGGGVAHGLAPEPVEWHHLAEDPDPTVGGVIPSPAGLLRARRAVVPFRGREEPLRRLREWSAEPGFGAFLVHGPGGQGKTRLAQHFADELAADRWATLWLRGDVDPAEPAALGATAVPLLVVLDYAETRRTHLHAVLKAAAGHRGGQPFKVLLLARAAGEWWRDLPAGTPAAEELLDGAPDLALSPLEPEADSSRRDAYREAVESLAARLPEVRGWERHDWTTLAGGLIERRAHARSEGDALARAGLEVALTLHMTALADLLDTAGDGGAAEPSRMGAARVEDRLLTHERRYWTTAADSIDLLPHLTRDTLFDALAAAMLLGATNRDEADAVLRRVPGLADQSNDRCGAVRAWIASLYPADRESGRPWGELQPDRLTERFIGRRLEDHPELADRLAPDLTEEQALRLLTIWTRATDHPVFDERLTHLLITTCVRHPGVLAPAAIDLIPGAESPAPLLRGLEQIAESGDPPLSDLENLADRLPQFSHRLADWSARLLRQLTDQHRRETEINPETLPRLARSLHHLAARLGHLGHHEDALGTVIEAVAIRRTLAENQPDTHLPDLAKSLNSLSVDLENLGRHEEALTAITEAVVIRRTLAENQPDAHLPDLAMSLNNLAIYLRSLGEHEKAMVAITEAVAIRRTLAENQPDTHLPDLATSLNSLSLALGDLARHEKALGIVVEAVAIRRTLAETRPDTHLPDLAHALNNLSLHLGNLGRHEEALTAITEAVAIRRTLAETRPDAHLPELAHALNNFSSDLGKLGYRDEALQAITEAVAIRRTLAETRPDAHLPDLAMSLNNLAVHLDNLGHHEEALQTITEAVAIRRTLAETRPDAHLPDLAMSLNNLAVHLDNLGHHEE
ncbi:tetratricopeptide repeat protein, partial [Streptomyces alkaliphilus]|uniref:tetratricopeptide repeat protein n=1 Tax=Streptomyces alkaliphilus TaxID=1472722 RepID=UPI00117E46B8